MTDPVSDCDVAVIGGGPSGLALATALRRMGVARVVVLERESEAGGIPRHCGHPPFGMREFGRVLTGPRYAERLVTAAVDAGVTIRSRTTVTAISPGPLLQLATPEGTERLSPRRVVLATGVRETPRSARLVSGDRALGVLTTGALQSTVYLKSRAPCRRPVILGSELVAFSALLTCRHAGIQPVAMVESEPRPVAWRAATALPRLMGVPFCAGSTVTRIHGNGRVTAVTLRDAAGVEKTLTCDGVVFSGRFTAEATLARMGHLETDPGTGGPRVDSLGRCSDPDYFAVGNVVHPADTAGRCWREGNALASTLVRSLAGELPTADSAVPLEVAGDIIRYVYPQRLPLARPPSPEAGIRIRFARAARGRLVVRRGNESVLERRARVLPERQMQWRLPASILSSADEPLVFHFEPE